MIRVYSQKSSISKYWNIYIWVSLNDHPYNINSGYLLFFETTNMGKTADLAMIQKTNIDALHKEGKSQKVIIKRVAVHRVLHQSILNAKLTGRKKLGRKRCTSNRDDRKLENTVKQSWFKHLGELHKEWTEAGVSASRDTTLRRLQEKGYQATSETETTSEASLLRIQRTGLLLSGPKSSFLSLEEDWRGTESKLLEVQWEVSRSRWWFGVLWRLLVLVHCVLSSPKSMQPSTRRFWSTLCFHLLTSFMEMLINFPAGL